MASLAEVYKEFVDHVASCSTCQAVGPHCCSTALELNIKLQDAVIESSC